MYIGLREVQMSREMMELEGVKARGTSCYGASWKCWVGSCRRVVSILVTKYYGSYWNVDSITVLCQLGNELGTSKSENQFGDASASVLSGDGKCDTLEAAEMNRNKEVVTLSISRIIWMLLKAFKCDNVLKFEYICQLLIDNNCAILILKMLSTWFQNPILAGQQQTDGPSQRAGNNDPLVSSNAVTGGSWLKEREEPSELNFFNIIPPSTSSTTTPSLQKGSYRAFQTTAHLLRILQKLTSRKPHRLLALVQWKASAVLKRIIKVPSPPLQLPALKLLKSQVPTWARNGAPGICASSQESTES
ncbi:hypothetical protein BCR33DRAFT_472176 [Rhizoclosmatium globosum]|uniref:Far11/STRP C-terminal domain-containing protein n=1 Tax=Rhizoclosmatium globosum TaxID=329046 RepID=A0A1Y2BQ23_9FUNG|nr:hypothetical protein BCR33DRAFT_472176 [Rhizoclosmatium globosum]|eukprot:ORY36842.1 hypothetical protein BCR33DRAFT_472176 [Rhizoclosmatium globosum]